MSNIRYYENLIQEKRKKTPFRDFVRDIWSWETLSFYKTNDGIISRYPETGRVKTLWNTFWEDAPDYTLEYIPDKPFLSQFRSLQDLIPLSHTLVFSHLWNNENCQYADAVSAAKNVYLSFVIGFWAENILYSAFCYMDISNVINSFLITKWCSEIANSHHITESYKVFYSTNIYSSSDIWFSTNLIGCRECIGCDNLENASFCIKNEQLSQEEYYIRKALILKDKKSFYTIWQHIQKNDIINFASENVSGIGVIKSSNTVNGLWINNMHHSRNVGIWSGDNWSQNIYDCIDVGVNGNDFYGVIAAGWSNAWHLYSCMQIDHSSHIYYSSFMWNCHYCLGCIWLKNKSYCILNKQYTKEEWEVLAEKIFASMEADGTLGEFFPASMNPFYFNDTLAYLIDDSFTKEEVEADGYLWRDDPIRADIPDGMRVVKNTELDQFQGFRLNPLCKEGAEWNEAGDFVPETTGKNPQSRMTRDSSFTKEPTWYIDPEVLKVVISDEKGNCYRIVQMEYDFLMKHALPLPTMHWLDRIKMGFQ